MASTNFDFTRAVWRESEQRDSKHKDIVYLLLPRRPISTRGTLGLKRFDPSLQGGAERASFLHQLIEVCVVLLCRGIVHVVQGP